MVKILYIYTTVYMDILKYIHIYTPMYTYRTIHMLAASGREDGAKYACTCVCVCLCVCASPGPIDSGHNEQ